MRELCAFAILAAVLLAIGILVCVEHRPQGVAMPLIHASQLVIDVPLLLPVCTPNRSNVPHFRENRA